ncbi:MAG: methionine adenosyltransferase [Nitrospinaceae bacterium]|jgi:S-adenosylmethionine synthetase|nr:methionine adenosyltransferase [Nitrospinaceae bacterium]MBT3434507.1 methionine adenosyltransferase [Nitrospinaceae bacterium]MBT4094409.1 methionine adenosyltransferase [Nitrospinaceae bacterium]MBT4432294.1 methionine adenosyltransferase [Nitrospinaceae bacterium]MBT6394680.1 methionine adenosyltransferase [Nitrospinaceae bacterium]
MASVGSKDFIFTSESVSEGHPDKMADQISDAILDAILAQDPNGRVACETLITTGIVFIAGEITTNAQYDPKTIARETIRRIGYDNAIYGFDCDTCAVVNSIDRQSPNISQGVSEGEGLFTEQGAGDQGMMFGFACKETEELMPLPIMLSHKLVERTSTVRRDGTLPYLRPDSKSQVSIRYENSQPVAIENVVISAQHAADITLEQIREDIITHVIKPIVDEKMVTKDTTFYVNPTGVFIIGGPMGDTGLTGRKIIVDTYGGYSRHGGGAFSGKDPSKVDRSAAYMARYVAKNIVAADLAERAEVQLAYAIGVADPVSVLVDDFGTGKVESEKLSKAVRNVFGLRPKEIIDGLDLKRPIFQKTAAYGHFGRDLPEFTWERTDKADELRKEVGL